MALGYILPAVKLVATIRDEAKNQTTKQYIVPNAVWPPATGLWADLITIRDNLATLLNAVTGGLIWKLSVIILQSEDTATKGAANTEVENLASVVVNLQSIGKTAVLQIPAPVIGIFQGTDGRLKNQVDLLDADLLAYAGLFQVTGGDFVLSDGEYIDDTDPLDSGKRIHRKSRKG